MVGFLRRKLGKDEDYAPEAEALFRRLAADYGLAIEKRPDDPVELSMVIPAQKDIRHEVWLALQNNDELWFVVDGFTCSLFPFRKAKDEFATLLRGVLSGQYRIVHRSWGRTTLERRENDSWKVVSLYTSLFGPKRRK